jgi:ankyrin repeat protein
MSTIVSQHMYDNTAIKKAVRNGPYWKVKLLLKKGAPANQCDINRISLFSYAVERAVKENNQFYIKNLKLLLKYGANPSVGDAYGILPYDIAERHGNTRIMTLINDWSRENL